jgi:uncharacterized protein (DUF111 family)
VKVKKLWVLEANIDDMNPEWFGPLFEILLESKALDVTLTPTLMKKGRPGQILSVLCAAQNRKRLLQKIFEETTSLGVRTYEVLRFELKREIKTVKTPYGPVIVKIGRDSTGKIVNVAPEFESCRKIAKEKKVSLKKIYESVRLISH